MLLKLGCSVAKAQIVINAEFWIVRSHREVQDKHLGDMVASNQQLGETLHSAAHIRVELHITIRRNDYRAIFPGDDLHVSAGHRCAMGVATAPAIHAVDIDGCNPSPIGRCKRIRLLRAFGYPDRDGGILERVGIAGQQIEHVRRARWPLVLDGLTFG